MTSFLTIGGLWLAHHGIFRRMRFADMTVLRMNIFLLMVVAFLPFPTTLVARGLRTTSGERPAVLFYGATLFVVTATISAIGRYVAARGELAREGTQAELRALAARTTPSLAFYGLVLLFAVLAPEVAAFGFLAVAAVAVVRPPVVEGP